MARGRESRFANSDIVEVAPNEPSGGSRQRSSDLVEHSSATLRAEARVDMDRHKTETASSTTKVKHKNTALNNDLLDHELKSGKQPRRNQNRDPSNPWRMAGAKEGLVLRQLPIKSDLVLKDPMNFFKTYYMM